MKVTALWDKFAMVPGATNLLSGTLATIQSKQQAQLVLFRHPPSIRQSTMISDQDVWKLQLSERKIFHCPWGCGSAFKNCDDDCEESEVGDQEWWALFHHPPSIRVNYDWYHQDVWKLQHSKRNFYRLANQYSFNDDGIHDGCSELCTLSQGT